MFATVPPSLAAGLRFHKRFLVLLADRVDLDTSSLVSAVDLLGEEVASFCGYSNWLENWLFELDGLERPPVSSAKLDLRSHTD